jgi:hypothetical protein
VENEVRHFHGNAHCPKVSGFEERNKICREISMASHKESLISRLAGFYREKNQPVMVKFQESL